MNDDEKLWADLEQQEDSPPLYIEGRLLWRLPDAIEHIAAMRAFVASKLGDEVEL